MVNGICLYFHSPRTKTVFVFKMGFISQNFGHEAHAVPTIESIWKINHGKSQENMQTNKGTHNNTHLTTHCRHTHTHRYPEYLFNSAVLHWTIAVVAMTIWCLKKHKTQHKQKNKSENNERRENNLKENRNDGRRALRNRDGKWSVFFLVHGSAVWRPCIVIPRRNSFSKESSFVSS